MEISRPGLSAIQTFEGLRLKVYKDVAGLLTVGYGHLVTADDHLVLGDQITQEQAEDFLRGDLADAVRNVNTQILTPISQNQFDALVSLVYNIGGGNFSASTVKKRLNEGNVEGAADAFLMWNKAGGVVNEGLEHRREAERILFLGDY